MFKWRKYEFQLKCSIDYFILKMKHTFRPMHLIMKRPQFSPSELPFDEATTRNKKQFYQALRTYL